MVRRTSAGAPSSLKMKMIVSSILVGEKKKFFPWFGVRAGELVSEMKIFFNPRQGINLSGRQEADVGKRLSDMKDKIS